MEKTNLTVPILVGVVLFIVGAALGIFYQVQIGSKSATEVKTVNALASKVIPSIVAYGKVTAIDGQNVTVSFDGDTLMVPIVDNAQVFAFTNTTATSAPVQQKSSFDKLKVGDNINISVKVLEGGKMQGESIFIMPSSAGS